SEKFLNDRNLSQDSKGIDNVIDLLVPMFQRAVNWGNPGTMLNIVPPVNVVSVAASSYASLFNPNLGQDETSGYLISAELLTAKYLSQLVDWDWKQSSGIFTFGGKGTNLYALKLGLNKAFGEGIQSEGISSFENNKAIVISTDKGHPCHKEVCDWLGLGTNSFKKIATTSEGTINLEELEKTLREAIEHDAKIACIYVNGGTSNEIIVDPIDKVVELRDKLVAEYKLSYNPHIHVDAVIGWAWLFFKEYDFGANPLGMSEIEL
ncbi:pyridoxal-dependent decarboxylase, partial [Streptococcus sanguinis]